MSIQCAVSHAIHPHAVQVIGNKGNTMAHIYDKHAKAFNLVSAGALVVNDTQIGTLSFKYPVKGEGRLTCFLHIHGYTMVSGSASGYGYDKAAASLESACMGLCEEVLKEYPQLKGLDCGGYDFQRTLESIGINYFKAV